MNCHRGLSVQPKVPDKLSAGYPDREVTYHTPKTSERKEFIRPMNIPRDSKWQPLKGEDGRIKKKVGKKCKLVDETEFLFICKAPSGNYPVCFKKDQEGIDWEFVN